MIRSSERDRASDHPKKRLDFIPGQMIVRIRPDAVRPALAAAAAGAPVAERVAALPEQVTKPIEYLATNVGLSELTPLFASVPRALRGRSRSLRAKASAVQSVAQSPSEDLGGFAVVSVDPKKMTARTARLVEASPAIQIAEPMPARWMAAARRRAKAAGPDPMLNRQWGLRAIGWFQAKHPSAAAIRRLPVAVLDSGVDQHHPDLARRVASYEKNGFRAEDVLGHGTHVAGIIAAVANNAHGVSGVAACPLHVWKIFPDEPWTDGEYYVDGEAYLRSLGELEAKGCRVVNLSIGGTQQSQAEAVLFRRLADRGIAVVAAMGNEYDEGNPIEFPAAYPGVIAVGAVGITLRRAWFSNTGAHILLVAPGVEILSTLPRRKSDARDEIEYASWDGTSMATPHVAGAVALLLAKHGELSASAVRRRLASSARKVPRMKGRRPGHRYGYGLLHLPSLL